MVIELETDNVEQAEIFANTVIIHASRLNLDKYVSHAELRDYNKNLVKQFKEGRI
jgi:hypothetical protein